MIAITAAGTGKRGRNEGVSSLDSQNKKAKGKQLSEDEEEANVMNLKSISSINGLEIRLFPHALRSVHPRLVHPSPPGSVTSLISPSKRTLCLCVWRSGEGINTTNDKGETYLHFAAFKAQPQLVKWLIEKGADCNMQVALSVRPECENCSLVLGLPPPSSKARPRVSAQYIA